MSTNPEQNFPSLGQDFPRLLLDDLIFQQIIHDSRKRELSILASLGFEVDAENILSPSVAASFQILELA